MSMHWGESPIDLPDEAPLERKFLDTGALDAADALDSAALPDAEIDAEVETGIRPGLGWASGALAISSAALIVLNAHAFGNWAESHPDTPGADLAYQWQDKAHALGLTRLTDGVEQVADKLRKAGW